MNIRFVRTRSACLLVSALAIFACQSPSYSVPKKSGDTQPVELKTEKPEFLIPDRESMFAELVPIVSRCIEQPDTSFPIFHGCWDWHSAVHAHWAILRAARASGEFAAEAAAVDRALNPRLLLLEAQNLVDHPDFEMPYGRAWYLRLAIEFKQWAEIADRFDTNRLQPMANEIARSLLEYFSKQGADPTLPEYANASWALAQLHAYYVSIGDGEGLAKTEAIIEKGFLKSEFDLGFGDDRNDEFFSRFGNWLYLVTTTAVDGDFRAFIDQHPFNFRSLNPVRPANAHGMGMNWSRAWAIHAAARRTVGGETRKQLNQAYERHVAAGWATHLKSAGNYRDYDHWVPQFAIYALTEGE
ncbi:MAG: DUF2891 family protein [Bacteriovoracia bacterium]